MDEMRWANVERARLAYRTDLDAIDSGPLEAFFEIAARCNLRCRMCAIRHDSRYRPGNSRPALFEPELFERLEPTFATLLRVSLFGLGEPLLNGHLAAYVRRLSAAGVEVAFTTNATLVDDRKAEELATAGLDRVTVSIDGATPGVYESIRVGARFDDVVSGIRAFAKARRRFGRPRSLSLSFVAMASNFGDLPRLVDLCADSVHVEPLYWQPQRELQAHYEKENLGRLDAGTVELLLGEARARAERLGVGLGSRLFTAGGKYDYVEAAKDLQIDWKCSEPWSSIWVTTAGEVRTCCINEKSFGNLFERSFDEIWNGEEFRVFRRQHSGRQEASGCATCYLNGRVRQSAYFTPAHPVHYRPLQRQPSDGAPAIEIDSPLEGETIADPIVISGRLSSEPGDEWELMLDETPLGRTSRAWRSQPAGYFVLSGPIPFVTEGAHLLWARRVGDCERGGAAWREVHLWRPESPARLVPKAVAFPAPRSGSDGAPPIEIDVPLEGETITDPIVISGRLSSEPGEEWELMLDETPLGRAARARRSQPAGFFVLAGPIPFVAEGAHLLWARRVGDRDGGGVAWREVHLWRPELPAGCVPATRAIALLTPGRWPVGDLRARIDGQPWPRTTVVRPGLLSALGLLHLDELPAGDHEVLLQVNRRSSSPVRIRKLT